MSPTDPEPATPDEGEQLALIRAGLPRASRAARAPMGLAETDPVASVLVDTGLAHLDRPFEYAVPDPLADSALPGVRVKVRFAGQDLDGWVLDRRAGADHDGRLVPLRRVVSAEPVLRPAVLTAARDVARRMGGTVGDVLRLAVPPRHAGAEKALPLEAPVRLPLEEVVTPAWEPYAAGASFLGRVAAGEGPWASLLAVPSVAAGRDWPDLLAQAAATAAAAGRGALLVVPDARDVARVEAAVVGAMGPGRHARLTADQGPQARYTAYLKVVRGHVDVVVGTRAAAWAPVHDLGLIAWWDDGDDLHDEPRAPYAPVREVALARARVEGAALLTAGFVRSVPVAALLEEGSVRAIEAPRAVVRAAVPRVRVAGEEVRDADPVAARAHLPPAAWRTAKEALGRGPVLVLVPRRGYLPALSCQSCRRPARCVACAGPLTLASPQEPPACRWCGRLAVEFHCPHCESTRLRSAVVGARRTAEELGRAFPGVPVTTSGADAVVDAVGPEPRLVIATPGAEPVAESGYAGALLLDAWALLERPDLRAGEEALRRWCGAAALVRPRPAGGHSGSSGGEISLCGAPAHATVPAIEALVRWDPGWFAERELAERREVGLPPARRVATVSGSRRAVEEAVASMRLPDGVERLGPLPVAVRRGPVGGPAPLERMLLTAPPALGDVLAEEVGALRARQSARKDPAPVTARLDPPDPAA